MNVIWETVASYLYYTWGSNLVIRRKARESVGLSGNESETLAEAQTLSEHLMVSGTLNPWGFNVFVARARQLDPWATNLYRLWRSRWESSRSSGYQNQCQDWFKLIFKLRSTIWTTHLDTGSPWQSPVVLKIQYLHKAVHIQVLTLSNRYNQTPVGVNYLADSHKSVSGKEQTILYTKYEC